MLPRPTLPAALALLTACGGPDPSRLAFALYDAEARAAGLAPRDRPATLPLALDPAEESPAGLPTLSAGELAWVRGARGRVEVRALGVEVATDALRIRGEIEAARALAELLDAELEPEPGGGFALVRPEVWSLAADVEPPRPLGDARPRLSEPSTGVAPGPETPGPALRAAAVGLYRRGERTVLLDAGGGATIFEGSCGSSRAGRFEVELALSLDAPSVVRIELDDGSILSLALEPEEALR